MPKIMRLWETRTFGLESESTREMNKFWALEPFLAEEDKTSNTTLWYGWGEQEISDCSDELHTGGAWSVRHLWFDITGHSSSNQPPVFLWLNHHFYLWFQDQVYAKVIKHVILGYRNTKASYINYVIMKVPKQHSTNSSPASFMPIFGTTDKMRILYARFFTITNSLALFSGD